MKLQNNFLNIPGEIRKLSPPNFDEVSVDTNFGNWPQWNERQENNLREELLLLENLSASDARMKIIELEQNHSDRRDSVWAKLGEVPLANAIKYLNSVVKVIETSNLSGKIEDLASDHQLNGWQADYAVLKAIASIKNVDDKKALDIAIKSVYLPWLEESATSLQKLVCQSNSYPINSSISENDGRFNQGDCILFVDGLRFDVAKQLSKKLEEMNMEVTESLNWSALPSFTATAKPAVSPVANLIFGESNNQDFVPCVLETGKSLKGGQQFNKLLIDGGWQKLKFEELGNVDGKAWCEISKIDKAGHHDPAQLAKQIEVYIDEVIGWISKLLNHGWNKVQVVTDHGWLILPGGLPKLELSSSLTMKKWGRYATLKEGTKNEFSMVPWYWNQENFIVLAEGVGCFIENQEYSHGGLSLQECLTLKLEVKTGKASKQINNAVIKEISWIGLRCSISVEGTFKDLTVDIRESANKASSSIAFETKNLDKTGITKVIVEDADKESHTVYVVLIDSSGSVVSQEKTIVGGD